ncbi:hypothetical protein [Helicobacter canis]|uniref:Porin domain-containing protein n=1 Tax=Helicobacter canis NCTC 12740 TaxID=1357399 RepID=V8CIM9_9HELI|nr:hypothetical protein [Helicobacter canis]ETD27224.1 hypothetical protein HMPREF2087_00132 [Helicobacter canis NCTC 12740]
MKSLNKLLLVSAVLSAALSQMSAYKVVDEDDKVIDVYGSARGYVGFGGSANATDTMNQGSIASTQAWGPYGSALYGLQSNSRLGVKAKVGNLNANAELGLSEPDGFRQMWGSYTFGSAGTLLFGKTDTPSVVKSLFASDLANTEQGGSGFGALRTANRKLQISYSIAGLTIALVDDSSSVVDARGSANEAIPRIAASYYLQNEDKTLDFQVGGAYKYYNKGMRAADESNDRFLNGSGSAFHIFTAIKSQVLDKKLYFSGMLHYGMNADLYKEQNTSFNAGSYKHTEWITGNEVDSSDIHRVGAYVESGYKFSDILSGVLGLGYQWSAAVAHTATTSQLSIEAHTMMVMAQLPIKLEKSLTLTPQIGYYGGFKANGIDANGYASSIENRNGVLAFVRLRYDF